MKGRDPSQGGCRRLPDEGGLHLHGGDARDGHDRQDGDQAVARHSG